MKSIKKYINKFKFEYTANEKLIVILAISLFLPFYITAFVFIASSIYILLKKDFISLFKSADKAKYLIYFSFYCLIVSLINKNYLGALISVALFLIFVCLIFYNKYLTKKIFEDIITIMIFLSLFAVLYAIIEQYFYSRSLEGIISYFDINNKPEYRVHTFFFNANYYAMMICFVEILCAYKMLNNKGRRKYYTFVALVNLFAMFLTGSRFAWICLLFAFLVMFLSSKNYKAFFSTAGVSFILILLTKLKVPVIPRLLEYGLDIGRRQVVYETSFLMIRDKWLFGNGPLTYFNTHANYYQEYVSIYGSEHLNKLGISSQHAHSMFFDPIISFGLIGTFILLIYIFNVYKKLFNVYKSHQENYYCSLLIGISAVVFSSDVFDYPIFWLQTGVFYLFIISSVILFKPNSIKN